MARQYLVFLAFAPVWVSAGLHLTGGSDTSSPSYSSSSATDNTVCSCIEAEFPGRVAYPGQATYNASQAAFYAAQERDVSPSCVFTPADTAELSQFIKLVAVASGNASSTPAQFAIRSGGHSLIAGAANMQNGVTVDMRKFNQVVLSEDHKTASIGGGAIFNDVYPQLDPYNVTVQGGRISGIAAGGFVSGGGKTFSGRKYGWSCDNVFGYEVVLANGQVVDVTATSYPDLWLALKGGSNNFGIVTRYDMEAFPQGDMWGGVLTYNYTSALLDAQAKAFSAFMDPSNFDKEADVGLILGFAKGAFTVQTSLFYLQPTPNPPTLQAFTSAPDIVADTSTISNVSNLVNSFSKDLPAQVPRITESFYSFKNPDAATYSKMISSFESGIKAIATTKNLQAQFLLQPQPVTNGTNAMGLEPDQHDVVMGLLTLVWSEETDDSTIEKAVEDIAEAQKSELSKQDLLLPFIYLNYADGTQDVFGSWGVKQKAFLQQVSKKYDPYGVFQKQVPGGFKLF